MKITNYKMNKSRVIKINTESLEFDNGVVLTSYHDTYCCESHHLSLNDLTLDDFDGLEFDLTNDNFFERIEGYGVALKPLLGDSVLIPVYGQNSGSYSHELSIILSGENGFLKTFNISECQKIKEKIYVVFQEKD